MKSKIFGVVLAAGLSKRMGQPKLILPWGETTVIGQVIRVLQACKLSGIIAVTGGAREFVEIELSNFKADWVFNSLFANGEMLDSIKTGLANVPAKVDAALIVLGDQPQIEQNVVRMILNTYKETRNLIIMPSYHMKRGHPWLIHKELWPEIMSLKSGQTMRDFFTTHERQIHYEVVETTSIFLDLDTPEDYQRQKPI